jgi:ribosome-binding protein aMBF1 (putative translation factor)
MKKKSKVRLITLDEFIEREYGARGTSKREKFEKEYEVFKVGYLVQHARMELGMTQEELAAKAGTTKSYISKIENNVKEARISTLQRIVERGLGGKLELRISF